MVKRYNKRVATRIKKEKTTNLTKAVASVTRCREEILRGQVLVIDPSCGSASSMPGYAIFEAGELVESGTIDVPLHKELWKRLRYISQCLREEFPSPDVFILEAIPAHRGMMSYVALASLNKAVGTFMTSVSYNKYVEISPSVWHSYIKSLPEYADRDYKTQDKGDEMDAIMIGKCVLALATGVVL